jgi:GT2 family glycosyltransferase
MRSAKIAVIIPVHNRKKDLIELLKTIFEMDYTNFDVIIVDNGSTDGISEISIHYPKLKILRNEKNYGAPIGFNIGIKYALSVDLYKYLWLLDSDLLVHKGCLSILVDIMEKDESIGIAGAKILNKNNHNLIVEIGANIDLENGQVSPLFCNEPDSEKDEIFRVDYVGSGVSLIRADVIKSVGLFDERYYFLWEDMDYGLAMNRKGYKVVSVSHAIVYHPPFTEKRAVSVDAYYGIRNPLLTISKYAPNLSRAKCIYNVLRRIFKGAIFRIINGYYHLALLSLLAIWDFTINNWGELKSLKKPPSLNDSDKKRKSEVIDNKIRKILILPSGTDKSIKQLIDGLRSKNNDVQISLVIQNYRRFLFESLPNAEIILYNDKSKYLLLEHILLFIKLFFKNFDLVINPNPERGSPFTYISKEVYEWDERSGSLFKSSENIFSLWKLVISVIAGELLALVSLPFVYLSSFRYKI